MPKEQNITGHRFGKWTAIRKVGSGRPQGAIYLCKCDCGTERQVPAKSLRYGKSTNCGCGRADDLSGRRFGNWTVLARDTDGPNRNIRWLCVCDCGTERPVFGAALKNGASSSCGGCLHRDRYVAEYRVWNHMLSRCRNPNNPAFKRYGGRGITVCRGWLSFDQFLADMGPRPPGTELDRINNNGPYSPENCRWADATTQANNRRSNRLITFNGKTQTLMQWAKETGIKRSTIQMRLDEYGWPLDKALTVTKLWTRQR
jgi:hypothetical protein